MISAGTGADAAAELDDDSPVLLAHIAFEQGIL